MFPNVPVSVIRSELVRGGSVQAAVERLLTVSSNYPARVTETSSHSTPPQVSLCIITVVYCKRNTLSQIKLLSEPEMPPLKVETEAWNKDQEVREKLLLQRKQEMLLRARK
jgi:hypothetical protein